MLFSVNEDVHSPIEGTVAFETARCACLRAVNRKGRQQRAASRRAGEERRTRERRRAYSGVLRAASRVRLWQVCAFALW